MTDEYINKQDLIRFIKENGYIYANTLERWPAAEVRPVIHAKWEIIPLNMDPFSQGYLRNLRKKCTACEYAMPAEYPNYNICPCCGAIMDGE